MNRLPVRGAALVAAVLLIGACSSSTSTAPPAGTPAAPPAGTPSATAAAVAAATAAGTPLPAQAASAAPSVAPSPTPKASVAAGLAGPWNGTWQDTSPDASSGTFTVTFAQTGTHLSGTIVVGGTPCITAGRISGTVTGSTISFGAVSGQVTITYDGSVSGHTMHGTYAAPACGDAKGTWSATKKG